MAIGFVDSKAHPTAMSFYRMFPIEPTGSGSSITVDSIHEIPNMTLDALLDNILTKAPSGGDILVVSHGTTNGMSIKLMSGATYKLSDYGAMETLMVDSVADAAKSLKLGEKQIIALREKLDKVKKLDIKHLALRACKIGSYESTMSKIKKFFDVDSVSAPIKRDAYFSLNPAPKGYATGESLWTAWERDHPLNPIEGSTPDRFAVGTEGGDDGTHTFSAFCLAESAKGITEWVQKHYVGSESFSYSRGSLSLHAMWNTPLLFPKDSDYVSNLRFFIKAEEF